MAKKGIKKSNEPSSGQETPEVKKQSVREIMQLASEEVISDAEKLIAKLKELELFAKGNSRPAKHFFFFQQQISIFIARFKKMLR